jgi:hypothetical protein
MFDFKKAPGGHFEAIIREVAERTAAAILSQLDTTTVQMNVAELRGYVRAHAWPRICTETKQLELSGLSRMQLNDLTARALEWTVHLVTREYLTAPVVAMPMPHIGLRAAA